MPFLRQITTRPAGALPTNLVTKAGAILMTVLLVGLILSVSLTGVGAEGVGVTPPQRTVDENVGQRLQSRVEEVGWLQERSLQAGERAAERQRIQAALAPLQEGGVVTGPGLSVFDPDESSLRRELRLQELERQVRSLRAGPVVLSFRDPHEENGSSVADPTLAGLIEQALQGGGGPLAAASRTSAVTAPVTTDPYAGPTKLVTPSDPDGWERVYESSFVEAVLVTQLSGDFPSPVLAQVSVPFYSADRQRILIPRGARFVGTAQPVRLEDQERLAVAFHRLIFPDGRYLPLHFQGLNQIGEGALKDHVDRHYLSMFLAAGSVGLLSGLTLTAANPFAGGLGALASVSAGQGLGRASTQIMQRFLNRLPTLSVRAGHRLRIWFTSDALIPTPTATGAVP